MITFIDNENDFLIEKEKYERVFIKTGLLPRKVFSNFTSSFLAFDFDLLFDKLLFDNLLKFIRTKNYSSLTFYTVNPDPDKYFYKHFNKYSIGVIYANETYANYMNFINLSPGNEADSLIYNAETITLFSDGSEWGIVCSKDWEIGIVGFKDEETRTLFLESFGEDCEIFRSLSEYIQDLDDMLHFTEKAKENYSKLLQNYSR